MRTYCQEQHTKLPIFLEKKEYWINRLQSETSPVQIKTEVPLNNIIGTIQFPEQPLEIPRNPLVCIVADKKITTVKRRVENINKQNKNKAYNWITSTSEKPQTIKHKPKGN